MNMITMKEDGKQTLESIMRVWSHITSLKRHPVQTTLIFFFSFLIISQSFITDTEVAAALES